MSSPRPGMGRGLAAILAVSDAPTATDGVRDLPVDLIRPNPNQPRRNIDEDALSALASSLSERGVLQPVLVRPRPGGYELIAGERRWRAARAAGLERIPALVRPAGDEETLELALIENMAREDLNPVEEARACAALAEDLGLTQQEIGARVGRSRVAISNLLRLLELPDEAIEMIERGELSEGHGRALLMAHDQGERRRLAHRAHREGWSVRTTEQRARESAGAKAQRERSILGSGREDVQSERAAVASNIAETLAAALGAEVRVRPVARGGYRAELSIASPEEALALARRLRPRSVA
ncbi:MAG: ParB/RepB/Spo0J family partition protein [Acidobacteriota bacterium]|nr:ParB/RepB/Spo0J family partition protein [Acidobacteriota bacterium]